MTEQSLATRVAQHAEIMRHACLVLYAGASLMPVARARLMTPELSAMPVMGPADAKEQPGATFVTDLEHEAAQAACDLFGADWAEVRLPSCTLANLAVYAHFTRPGDTVLGPAAADGGHLSQRAGGTPALVGLEVQPLVYDPREQMLDQSTTVARIKAYRPSLVILGRSVVLKPDLIETVVDAAHDHGALVMFDASHVLGLIAGGAFPNPFEAGVDLITSSTYKTLCGPTGGVVLGARSTDGEKFSNFLNAGFLANQDAARLPALLDAFKAFQTHPGRAQRILSCATALKAAFRNEGIDVLLTKEPAQTHQIVVPIGSEAEARAAMLRLEAGNVLVGTCAVPGRSGEYGLRFGAQILADVPGLTHEDYALLARGIGSVLATSDEVADRFALSRIVRDMLAHYEAVRPLQ
ncbi:hypothetical protein [Celeribacter sp.]|uniref:hypothetical protein n=1 Tax=Celeribacter sp. TaxID=1890673 RepID=UPI003A93C7A0